MFSQRYITTENCNGRGKQTANQTATKAIDTAALIRQEPPQGEDMAFTHSILCQVGLPRSKVAGREFMRRSGDAWLVVQAGWIDEGSGPVEQPLPYGAMPRLTFAWISSYALRNKTREIAIGHSANEFLHLMGMDSQEPVIKRCVHKCRRWPRVVCSWALRAGPITASLSNSLTPGSKMVTRSAHAMAGNTHPVRRLL